MKHTSDHMAAIVSGAVTKTNVIGLRKILNADIRRSHGWSVSSTCPKYTHDEAVALERALLEHRPVVTGELHETGLTLLRSPRYKRRLAGVKPIIDALDFFRLVGFDRIGRSDQYTVPVYEAHAGKQFFTFRNIPWQSDGNGPEIVPYYE